MAVFRVEKTRDFTVMSNHHLRNTELSLKAKGLLSLMLSLPENWDYTTRGLASICKDGVDSICSTLKELEKHGYLTRERLRDERGRVGDTEYTIHEQPVNDDNPNPPEKPGSKPSSPKREKPNQVKPDAVSPKLEKPDQANPDMVKPDMGEPNQENPAQSSINNQALKKSSTNALNINQSIRTTQAPGTYSAHSNNGIDGMDRIDGIEVYRDIIKSNIDYDILCEQYGAERLDEFVELMLETICSTRKHIRIAGQDFPAEVVKSRLLKLDFTHVEYVLDCLSKNTTKVRNIKAYMLTSIYNAPVTIDSYYRAEVNHDMYGNK